MLKINILFAPLKGSLNGSPIDRNISASLGISCAVNTSVPSSKKTLRAADDNPSLSVQISSSYEKG